MRTHLSGHLSPDDIGQTVTLAGWVLNRRDHGGVIFIDLRDRSGRVQVVADPDAPEPFAVAEQARNEFVLRVVGTVRRRPDGTDNPDLPTGEIEVVAEQMVLLSRAEPLPFQLDDIDISEPVRLKYRFLDLRRPAMQSALRLRHRLISELRRFLDAHDFVDIETPILTRSTPEGARDYLVPSRTHPGAFFALPQSPQLFKQLLMVAGFERYYQIARCFRDEDLRADRQPEFTQLDVEMSFVDENDVITLMEQMIRELFKAVAGAELPEPIPRLSHADALARYGTDRPDLRIPLELTELTDLMKEVEFKVFSAPASHPAGRVAALNIPAGGSLSRAQIDQYTEFVKQFGAGGLAYIKVNDAGPKVADLRAGLHSPILKFLPDQVLGEILKRSGANSGDLIFFGADKSAIVNDALGALRLKVAADLGRSRAGNPTVGGGLPAGGLERRSAAPHHPFTEDVEWLDSDPGRVLSGAGTLVDPPSDLQRLLNALGIEIRRPAPRRPCRHRPPRRPAERRRLHPRCDLPQNSKSVLPAHRSLGLMGNNCGSWGCNLKRAGRTRMVNFYLSETATIRHGVSFMRHAQYSDSITDFINQNEHTILGTLTGTLTFPSSTKQRVAGADTKNALDAYRGRGKVYFESIFRVLHRVTLTMSFL